MAALDGAAIRSNGAAPGCAEFGVGAEAARPTIERQCQAEVEEAVAFAAGQPRAAAGRRCEHVFAE